MWPRIVDCVACGFCGLHGLCRLWIACVDCGFVDYGLHCVDCVVSVCGL